MHLNLKHPTKPGKVIVPIHGFRDLKIGTLKSIERREPDNEVVMARRICPAVIVQDTGDGPDDGYGVIFADFPGCVSSGETIQQAADMVAEALSILGLPFHEYNIIVVNMLPALVLLPGSPWTVLPPGRHTASLEEVATAFGTNAWRRELFEGLVLGCRKLRLAGCLAIYLDGSYVTGKPRPGDFDACWDPTGVDLAKLDPVFLEFANSRAAQKAAFKGEFFPSSMMCADVGQAFVDFFQMDRFTGKQKGIISIPLPADPLLSGKVQP